MDKELDRLSGMIEGLIAVEEMRSQIGQLQPNTLCAASLSAISTAARGALKQPHFSIDKLNASFEAYKVLINESPQVALSLATEDIGLAFKKAVNAVKDFFKKIVLGLIASMNNLVSGISGLKKQAHSNLQLAHRVLGMNPQLSDDKMPSDSVSSQTAWLFSNFHKGQSFGQRPKLALSHFNTFARQDLAKFVDQGFPEVAQYLRTVVDKIQSLRAEQVVDGEVVREIAERALVKLEHNALSSFSKNSQTGEYSYECWFGNSEFHVRVMSVLGRRYSVYFEEKNNDKKDEGVEITMLKPAELLIECEEVLKTLNTGFYKEGFSIEADAKIIQSQITRACEQIERKQADNKNALVMLYCLTDIVKTLVKLLKSLLTYSLQIARGCVNLCKDQLQVYLEASQQANAN